MQKDMLMKFNSELLQKYLGEFFNNFERDFRLLFKSENTKTNLLNI